MNFVSWSGGKDSTATIILCHENNIPIEKILFSEVMFDDKISGELPEHIKFVKEIAIPKFSEWGYETEILHSNMTYYKDFHIACGDRSKYKGKLRGFPIGGMCLINRDCKIPPIKQFYKQYKGQDYTQFVGIAIDEPKRLARLEGTNKVSLLAEYNYTEEMAYDLCKEYGLLSPIYEFSKRGGCWFCPNQKISELSRLRKDYPQYWDKLKELSKTPNLCSYGFKYGKTVEEVDQKLNAYDDEQKLLQDQISMFDWSEE